MNDPLFHPLGEPECTALMPVRGPVAVVTFGGRVHVEWDAQAAVTPLGQLPFFIISAMLNAVLSTERFPVQVEELALEYSRSCFPGSPVDRVQSVAFDGFDGMLVANTARSKWRILYNSATPSEAHTLHRRP